MANEFYGPLDAMADQPGVSAPLSRLEEAAMAQAAAEAAAARLRRANMPKAPHQTDEAAMASAAAGLVPGSGFADFFGQMPDFKGGSSPSFGQNVQQGNYGTAALQTLGLGGDMLQATPLFMLGTGIKAAREAARAARTVKGATKAGEEIRPLADIVENPRAVVGDNNPPPDISGSHNPLDNTPIYFGGKQPRDFTPEEWAAFGKHYGVENLGPLSPLQTLKDASGREFSIPGGTEGKWTYYDLLHMKANPINPSEMGRDLHIELQKKLGRTHTPENLSDADVWNGLVFGMTSPNNPLFPNQMAQARLRLRTPEMLDDLASSIPWKAGDDVPKEVRKAANDRIAQRYGLAAEKETGGLGVRGTADYTRIAEMAQLFKKDPEFFRKAPNESWEQAVERISSQLPGLSMKTGSFGTVWQDPADAAISAIDRHMARELEARGGLFSSPEEKAAWQDRGVNLWNNREQKRVIEQTKKNEKLAAAGKPTRPVEPADLATDFADLSTKRGFDGHVGEMLLDHVGNAATPKFRYASGEINPDIPQHLAQAAWVREPETVFKMGRAYKQALDLNQKLADESGLKLFMSQWLEWDRIRNRFEPHENMFPGLSRLPAPSIEQLRDVNLAHKQTGHKTYNKDEDARLPPTRPLGGSTASRMGYLGLGGLSLLPAIAAQRRQEGAAD